MLGKDSEFDSFLERCSRERRVSVRDLLANAKYLGLPAFQRGAVWDEGQACDLLDSLQRNFFVGTLLLWVPPTLGLPPGSVPLVAEASPRALLLDGQQRLRALYGAFVPHVDDRNRVDALDIVCVRQSDAGSGTTLGFWHGRRREGDKSGGAFPLALFATMIDGLEERALQYPFARRASSGEAHEGLHELRSLSLGDLAWGAVPDALLAGVRKLLEASIAVEVVRFEEAEAIFNYRRLNAGGSGLKHEELDFASLVEMCPEGPSDWLHKSLAAWNDDSVDGWRGGALDSDLGDERDPSAEVLELRDSLLERGQERQFGLRLLVRAVGIACDLAAGETGGETGRRLDSERLGEPARARELLHHAGESVLTLASILNGSESDRKSAGGLTTGLGCDDRSRIPRKASAFGALLAVLIRFPELRSPENRPTAAALALGMFAGEAPPNPFRTVARALSADEAARALLAPLRSDLDAGKLQARVENELSSFGAHVDVLYWLLRRGRWVEGRQVSASDVPAVTASGARVGVGGLLRYQCRATRQHIVPWSKLTPRPARTAKHWINSIGNLTWISSAANGLDGWGASPMVFGEAGQGHYAEQFDPMLARLRESGSVPAEAQELVEARATAIGAALQAWWDDAARAASEHTVRPHRGRSFPMPRTLRTILYDWWRDDDVVDLAELVIFRIGWAKATSNAAPWGPGDKHRSSYLARVRTRRSWTGALPDQVDELGQFRVEVRWPGEDAASPKRWITIDRDAVTVPDRPGAQSARRFVIRDPLDRDDLVRLLRGMLATWPELLELP